MVVAMAVNLHDLLQQRYSGQAWAFCFEVPDGTSSNKKRTIDALAMGCWRSEGIHLHGHEIKHSRSDWLRELNDTAKQMTWMPYLHKFWVVAAKGVVKIEELPAEWGLMENRGNGLKVSKAASLLHPQAIPHTLLAAIMRRILLTPASKAELDEKYRMGYEHGKRAGDRSRELENRVSRAEKKSDELERIVRDFEDQSGITITGWHARNVGQAFAAFQKLQSGAWEQCLKAAREFIANAEAVESVNAPRDTIDDLICQLAD